MSGKEEGEVGLLTRLDHDIVDPFLSFVVKQDHLVACVRGEAPPDCQVSVELST